MTISELIIIQESLIPTFAGIKHISQTCRCSRKYVEFVQEYVTNQLLLHGVYEWMQCSYHKSHKTKGSVVQCYVIHLQFYVHSAICNSPVVKCNMHCSLVYNVGNVIMQFICTYIHTYMSSYFKCNSNCTCIKNLSKEELIIVEKRVSNIEQTSVK